MTQPAGVDPLHRPCVCPNPPETCAASGRQMVYHPDDGSPGGEFWKCATCGIERMWPDQPLSESR